jgi:hypothetical protein
MERNIKHGRQVELWVVRISLSSDVLERMVIAVRVGPVRVGWGSRSGRRSDVHGVEVGGARVGLLV